MELDLANGILQQDNRLPATLLQKVCKHLQVEALLLKGETQPTKRSWAVALVRHLHPAESKTQQAQRAQKYLRKGTSNEFLEAIDLVEIINRLDPDNRQVFDKYQEQSLHQSAYEVVALMAWGSNESDRARYSRAGQAF